MHANSTLVPVGEPAYPITDATGPYIVTAASGGKVFVWSLGRLERRWTRLRATSAEMLTNANIDESSLW